MDNTVILKGFFELGGVDYSDRVYSMTLNLSRAELDAVSLVYDTDVFEIGRKAFTLGINFRDDFTDGKLNDDVWTKWDGGVKFTVKFRFKRTARGPDNPEYQYEAFIGSFETGGDHGSIAGGSLGLPNTSDGRTAGTGSLRRRNVA